MRYLYTECLLMMNWHACPVIVRSIEKKKKQDLSLDDFYFCSCMKSLFLSLILTESTYTMSRDMELESAILHYHVSIVIQK